MDDNSKTAKKVETQVQIQLGGIEYQIGEIEKKIKIFSEKLLPILATDTKQGVEKSASALPDVPLAIRLYGIKARLEKLNDEIEDAINRCEL